MDYDRREDEEDTKCSGHCDTCPNKTFDSDSSYEFICNKYGWSV